MGCSILIRIIFLCIIFGAVRSIRSNNEHKRSILHGKSRIILPRRLSKSHLHRRSGQKDGAELDVEGKKYHIKDSLEPGINIILDQRSLPEHNKSDDQPEPNDDGDIEHVDSFSDIKPDANKDEGNHENNHEDDHGVNHEDNHEDNHVDNHEEENDKSARFIETDFGQETKSLSQFLNKQKTKRLKMILPGGHEFQLLSEATKLHSPSSNSRHTSDSSEEKDKEVSREKAKLHLVESFDDAELMKQLKEDPAKMRKKNSKSENAGYKELEKIEALANEEESHEKKGDDDELLKSLKEEPDKTHKKIGKSEKAGNIDMEKIEALASEDDSQSKNGGGEKSHRITDDNSNEKESHVIIEEKDEETNPKGKQTNKSEDDGEKQLESKHEAESGIKEESELRRAEETEAHHTDENEVHHTEESEKNHTEENDARHAEDKDVHHSEGSETPHVEETEVPHTGENDVHHSDGSETPHVEETEVSHTGENDVQHNEGIKMYHGEGSDASQSNNAIPTEDGEVRHMERPRQKNDKAEDKKEPFEEKSKGKETSSQREDDERKPSKGKQSMMDDSRNKEEKFQGKKDHEDKEKLKAYKENDADHHREVSRTGDDEDKMKPKAKEEKKMSDSKHDDDKDEKEDIRDRHKEDAIKEEKEFDGKGKDKELGTKHGSKSRERPRKDYKTDLVSTGVAPGVVDHSQFLPQNLPQAGAPEIIDHSKFIPGLTGLAPGVEDHTNFIPKPKQQAAPEDQNSHSSRESGQEPPPTYKPKGNKFPVSNNPAEDSRESNNQRHATSHVDAYVEASEPKNYKTYHIDHLDDDHMSSTDHNAEHFHGNGQDCGMTPVKEPHACNLLHETYEIGHGCSEPHNEHVGEMHGCSPPDKLGHECNAGHGDHVGETHICEAIYEHPTEYHSEPDPPAPHGCGEPHDEHVGAMHSCSPPEKLGHECNAGHGEHVGETHNCEAANDPPTEYHSEPAPPAPPLPKPPCGHEISSCDASHAMGLPEEPVEYHPPPPPHIKHKPDIIKVEFVPEEISVTVGNKSKPANPSGKIRVQFVPGEAIADPPSFHEDAVTRSNKEVEQSKKVVVDENKDIPVSNGDKNANILDESHIKPPITDKLQGSPKFGSNSPGETDVGKTESQEESVVGTVVLENGKLSAVHQSTPTPGASPKKKHKTVNGYEAQPSFLPFGVKPKSTQTNSAAPGDQGLGKHDAYPNGIGYNPTEGKYDLKTHFVANEQAEYHPNLEPEPRIDDGVIKPVRNGVEEKQTPMNSGFFNGKPEGFNDPASSYRETSSAAPIMRSDKADIAPHRSSKSINGYELKPSLPQMIEKKGTDKALDTRRLASEMPENQMDKDPPKADNSFPSDRGVNSGGAGGTSGAGGGPPGGNPAAPSLPSPETDERIDPEFTSLGQQYPDAVPSEVKNAVSQMRANQGGTDQKPLMPGGEKLPLDPDRVFMGGSMPMAAPLPPQDPNFGGAIPNPDPNPTHNAPTDLNAQHGIINPVVSHLVDAINNKAVSTEEALQMMNDFVSGNQDMSKAAKNVEGMLSQIQSQRRASAPASSDAQMGLQDSPPLIPSMGSPADDSSHFFNPGGPSANDGSDGTHFFNPGPSGMPNPGAGVAALGGAGLGLPGMEPSAVNDKDATFFNPGGGVNNMEPNPSSNPNPPLSKIGHVSNLNQLPDTLPFMFHGQHTPLDSSSRMFDHNSNSPVSYSERGDYVAQDLSTGSMRRVAQQPDRDDAFHSPSLFGSQRGDGRQMDNHGSQSIMGDRFDSFDNSDMRKPMAQTPSQSESFTNGKEPTGMESNEHSMLPATDLIGNLDMDGNSHLDGEGAGSHMDGVGQNNHIDAINNHMGHGDATANLGIGEPNVMHHASMHFIGRGSKMRHNSADGFINNRFDDNSEAELPQGHFMSNDFSGKSLGLPDSEVSSSFSRKFQTPHRSDSPRHSIMPIKKTRTKPGTRKHNVIADMYADSIFPEDINDIDSFQGSLEGKALSHFSHQESATRRTLQPENVQSVKASFPLEGSTAVSDVRSSVPHYDKLEKRKLHRNSTFTKETKENRPKKIKKIHIPKKPPNLNNSITTSILGNKTIDSHDISNSTIQR